VNEIFFKASQVNNPGPWRCKEQLDLSLCLIDMDVDLNACRMLAGAGQGTRPLPGQCKLGTRSRQNCASWLLEPDGKASGSPERLVFKTAATAPIHIE
jgi:hypothetical protein